MAGPGLHISRRIGRLGVVLLAVVVGAGIALATGLGAATSSTLNAVTCEGPSFCLAVGSMQSAPFVARYDGASWAADPTPAVTNGALNGVACTRNDNCVAVGWQGPTNKTSTLVEQWNGSYWLSVPSPNRSGSNLLTSISCVSASFCVAAGSSGTSAGNVTLVEQWNGSRWKIVSSPNFHGNPYDESHLFGVSCSSAKQCFAVGWTANSDEAEYFIIRWNGRAWSISARQLSAVAQQAFLTGVACTTATACMAVGYQDEGLTLPRDRWNGSKWNLTEGKLPRSDPYDDHEFYAISCTSATACLAVGSEERNFPYAQRLNGSTWKQTSPPQRGDSVYGFTGVSCVAADNCYAVGGNVVEQWQPGHWTTVATFS